MRRADQKGLCLHASAVNVAGKALLFLGYSTSGKSTISRLLSERYPVIADDRVWVFKNKGFWLIQNGSNYFSTKDKKTNIAGEKNKYPLLAIVRIFKSKTLEVEPLSAKKACRYLMDAVFEIDFQRRQKDFETKKKWFSAAAEISKIIAGWRLTFKKDKSIIKKIHETFEERLLSKCGKEKLG